MNNLDVSPSMSKTTNDQYLMVQSVINSFENEFDRTLNDFGDSLTYTQKSNLLYELEQTQANIVFALRRCFRGGQVLL
jgi:hypothetical protein